MTSDYQSSQSSSAEQLEKHIPPEKQPPTRVEKSKLGTPDNLQLSLDNRGSPVDLPPSGGHPLSLKDE